MMESLQNTREVLITRVEQRTRSFRVEDVFRPVDPRVVRSDDVRERLAHDEGRGSVERSADPPGEHQVRDEDQRRELDGGCDPGGDAAQQLAMCSRELPARSHRIIRVNTRLIHRARCR